MVEQAGRTVSGGSTLYCLQLFLAWAFPTKKNGWVIFWFGVFFIVSVGDPHATDWRWALGLI